MEYNKKYHFSGYINNVENVYAIPLGEESKNQLSDVNYVLKYSNIED